LNIVGTDFVEFEECSFDHFSVDSRIVELSHLLTDALQISQLFYLLNQYAISLLFVEHKEN
jgi:hypothetical protein